MLPELQQLHASILANLDELKSLTTKPEPAMARLPAVRLALTRASRARNSLLEQVYGDLIARAPAQQRAELQALRAEARVNLAHSVQHIGTWTLREMTGRWAEYCAASNTMQAEMRARVAKEAALTYHLLGGLSGDLRVA